MGEVGGLDQIPSESIKCTLLKFIKEHCKSDEIEIRVEPGSEKGDNLMGIIHRVSFGKTENGKCSESIILKIPTHNLERRNTFKLRRFFLREVFMYNEVLPYFRAFQSVRGVVDETGFNEYPQCLASLDDELSECLLLEDLHKKQMKMIDHRRQKLSYEHVALVMKALGKLHAISFALKGQRPQQFAEITGKLNEIYYDNCKEFRDIFDLIVKQVGERSLQNNRLDLLEKWEHLIKDGVVLAGFKATSSEQAEPYAVICHGDAWMNNCMFRNDSQQKPIATNLIDWQFSRYASPVTDIVLNLICCTTRELRDAHFDDLLKVYHSSLSNLLTRLGSDPEKLFSFKVLLAECKKFGKYAAIVGSVLFPMISVDTEEAISLDKEGDLQQVFQYEMSDNTQQKYDRKVIETFEDLVRLDYF